MSESTRRWRWRLGTLAGVCALCALLLANSATSAAGIDQGDRGSSSLAVSSALTAGVVPNANATLHTSNGTALRPPVQEVPSAPAGLMPARLVIPEMGLDAPVLSLGPDAQGAMQAPRVGSSSNPVWSEVYWWNVGAAPGQIGNAVIAGHVNRPDGSPSTFTDLNRLHPGDEFAVVTVDGTTLRFRVTAKDAPLVYVDGANNPTVERIFGPTSAPHLNLMTCWGEWDGREYNRRLVVYSTLLGASPFPTSGTAPAR